ncbi:SUMO-activating enzyme subunit 1 [Ischnura elegans]|uniref:SUMO-activating enzyme subunit 1 n=1 Tax=Ischnura elegans TaxID=197161 RepID=UPI001ED8B0B5|nr:SUMO-activating enzyme subunit 1 [Ischnura elegans]
MVETVSGHELTEDEAALYDRQIRLWGVESQRRLRGANILLIGVKGLGAEICKNIVLAGVKSITLLDYGALAEEDFGTQFLAARSDVGKTRAEASITRARRLNPMVDVKVAPPATGDAETDPSFRPDSFFSEFQVVIATGLGMSSLLRLNSACRRASTETNKICFFAGDVFGFHGFLFSDLQEHVHVEKTQAIIPGNTKSGVPATITSNTTVTKHFVPLEEPFSLTWNSGNLANVHDSFFLVKVLLTFRDENGRNPSISSKDADLEKLKAIRNRLLSETGAPEDIISDSALEKSYGEACPVCAIMGGFLAQEVVKAVSQMDAPFDNFLLFEPDVCEGVVYRIAKDTVHRSFKKSKKKDQSPACTPSKKMKV